jgi:hypothetical protein
MKFSTVLLFASLAVLSLEFLFGKNTPGNQEDFLKTDTPSLLLSISGYKHRLNPLDDTYRYKVINNSINSDYLNRPDSLKSLNQSSLLKNVVEDDTSSFFYTKDNVPKWHTMITKIPSDCVEFWKGYITNENLPIILGIAVSTAGLIITDDITWKESERFYRRTQFNQNFSDFFTEIGDGRTQFILAGGFAAYGFIGHNNRALRTASQIIEAVIASGGVVQVLKHITGREDPNVSSAPGGLWRFFPNQITYHKKVPYYDAYPSGHLTTSIATFVVIANNYPEYKWIKPASWVLSGCIAFGMVNQGIHWYSDYPLAIGLGYAFGELISKPNNISDVQQSKNILDNIKIYPSYSINGAGLTLHLDF